MDKKNRIAKRVAAYFKSGDVVNLGIGIPGLCSNYAEEGVLFQSENGFLGCGKLAEGLEKVESFCDASGNEFVPLTGGTGFDSAISFGMIRGGRVTATVLGALQVDKEGNLANWALPGRMFGMGGAMDLVNGARKVILAMELCSKDGSPKILNKCTFPLTGKKCVDLIVCEYGVIEVTKEGLKLVEILPGTTPDEIQKKVEPKLILAEDMKLMHE